METDPPSKEQLHAQIEEELKEIIRLQHKIQTELDGIIRITKPKGFLSETLNEGIESTQTLSNTMKISFKEDAVDRFKQALENLQLQALRRDISLPSTSEFKDTPTEDAMDQSN